MNLTYREASQIMYSLYRNTEQQRVNVKLCLNFKLFEYYTNIIKYGFWATIFIEINLNFPIKSLLHYIFYYESRTPLYILWFNLHLYGLRISWTYPNFFNPYCILFYIVLNYTNFQRIYLLHKSREVIWC